MGTSSCFCTFVPQRGAAHAHCSGCLCACVRPVVGREEAWALPKRLLCAWRSAGCGATYSIQTRQPPGWAGVASASHKQVRVLETLARGRAAAERRSGGDECAASLPSTAQLGAPALPPRCPPVPERRPRVLPLASLGSPGTDVPTNVVAGCEQPGASQGMLPNWGWSGWAVSVGKISPRGPTARGGSADRLRIDQTSFDS